MCKWYKAAYNITVTGEKGTVTFTNDTITKSENSSALEMDLQFFGRKRDLAQVDAVARKYNVDKHAFSDYIHSDKGHSGRGGSDNFSFAGLIELVEEYIENGGR